jgi:hypothetical protein
VIGAKTLITARAENSPALRVLSNVETVTRTCIDLGQCAYEIALCVAHGQADLRLLQALVRAAVACAIKAVDQKPLCAMTGSPAACAIPQ